MADGVDHIDIYADVGEEFNQVGEGLGLGSAAEADGAAAWTLTGVAAGREPGSAADREPGASGPRRCVCGVPLTPCSRASFLRAVERGAGSLCSRRRPLARPLVRPLARPFLTAASRPIVGYGGWRFPPS